MSDLSALRVRTDPATLPRPLNGDHAVGLLVEQYERDLIEEARLIAVADEDEAATAEHLRVLLRWLDGTRPAGSHCPRSLLNEDVPF